MANPGRDTTPAVIAHWRTRIPDFDAVMARLRENGVDTDNLTVEDFNKIDLMHIGGEEATDTLADLAGITSDTEVLDAGCGIGGTSRRIAHLRGAHVTGIDLTPGAADTANALTELLGLADRVHTLHGSITDMPFDAQSFDVILIQHCAMQIAAKDELFAECRRVLRPGGTLAMHDWFEGAVKPLNYPLPWAGSPEISFLETVDSTTDRLKSHGFTPEPFVEQTPVAIKSLNEARDRINHHLALGRTLRESQKETLAVANAMIPNLSESRLHVGFLVAHLTGP